eukprot:3657019-Rhodomonas_salina.1
MLTRPCLAQGLFGAFAILLWGAGFGLESVADWQKWSFKQTPEGSTLLPKTRAAHIQISQRSWCQQVCCPARQAGAGMAEAGGPRLPEGLARGAAA